jgi:hypothetical protein
MTEEQIDSLTIKQAAALVTSLFMNQRKMKGGDGKRKDELIIKHLIRLGVELKSAFV